MAKEEVSVILTEAVSRLDNLAKNTRALIEHIDKVIEGNQRATGS